jgi:hypothetical protein
VLVVVVFVVIITIPRVQNVVFKYSNSFMNSMFPDPIPAYEERMTSLSTSYGTQHLSTNGAIYGHSHTPLLELRRRSKTDVDDIGNHVNSVQKTMHAGIAVTPDSTHFVQRPHSPDDPVAHSPTQSLPVSGQFTPTSLDSLATTNIPDPGVDTNSPPGGASAQSQPLSHSGDDPIILDVEDVVNGSFSAPPDQSEETLQVDCDEGEGSLLNMFINV